MSNLVVNTITPHTTSNVDFAGIDVPSYQGLPLAMDNEVVKLTGSTMTGPLILSANAAAALGAVPKQQLDTAIGTVNTTISNLGSTHLFSADGYYTAPGGLIIQWASVTTTDPTSGQPGYAGSVTWPIAFPTGCLKVIAGIRVAAAASNNIALAVTGFNTGTASFQIMEWGNSVNPCTVDFIAVGY